MNILVTSGARVVGSNFLKRIKIDSLSVVFVRILEFIIIYNLF